VLLKSSPSLPPKLGRLAYSTKIGSRGGLFARNGNVMRQIRRRIPCSADTNNCAILFDFDGTIGDTETVAMEVAYWELAAYFIDPKPDQLDGKLKLDWIRENCGKPFGEMADDLDVKRLRNGMSPLKEQRKNADEDSEVMQVIDAKRLQMGLKTIKELRESSEEVDDLWDQARSDFEMALETLAKPCRNVPELLEELEDMGLPFNIATTSPKPRVPISIKAAGLGRFFPPEKVHSGESDFKPSRFKPDPSVYLKAAEAERVNISDCIAFEDSVSGVGSAANAGVGMIIGYVGASHIPMDEKNAHAEQLCMGKKSELNRGADVVIWNIMDSIPLIHGFMERRRMGLEGPHAGHLGQKYLNLAEGRVMLNAAARPPQRSTNYTYP